jgi:hypothetical protein
VTHFSFKMTGWPPRPALCRARVCDPAKDRKSPRSSCWDLVRRPDGWRSCGVLGPRTTPDPRTPREVKSPSSTPKRTNLMPWESHEPPFVDLRRCYGRDLPQRSVDDKFDVGFVSPALAVRIAESFRSAWDDL